MSDTHTVLQESTHDELHYYNIIITAASADAMMVIIIVHSSTVHVNISLCVQPTQFLPSMVVAQINNASSRGRTCQGLRRTGVIPDRMANSPLAVFAYSVTASEIMTFEVTVDLLLFAKELRTLLLLRLDGCSHIGSHTL